MDILSEKGLIKIMDPLTNGVLEEVMKEADGVLSCAIKEVESPGNEELKRQAEMGFS